MTDQLPHSQILRPQKWAARLWQTTSILLVKRVQHLETKIEDLEQQRADILEEKNRWEQLSLRDELTGLWNRRGAARAIEGVRKKAENDGTHIAFLMIDLDNFGEKNKAFGHLFGDSVLNSVCTTIDSQLRHGEAAIRLGGEEIYVAVLSNNESEALAIAERLPPKRLRFRKLNLRNIH